MKIILVQAEIELAIRAYVLTQIAVKDGQDITIDFKNTRGDDGKVDGSHSSTATSARGATYNGSTTVTDGQVSHTGACTNAAGAAVDCPQRKDGDNN